MMSSSHSRSLMKIPPPKAAINKMIRITSSSGDKAASRDGYGGVVPPFGDSLPAVKKPGLALEERLSS